MICPFRKNQGLVRYGYNQENETKHEWFEDCYEDECPYYDIKDGEEICRQTEEK